MSNNDSSVASAISRTDLIRSLNEGLHRITLGYTEEDELILVTDVKSSKYGVDVECTDGTKFSLELKM